MANRGGLPPHVPTEATRALVEKMVGPAGCTQEQIALVLDIHVDTLRKYYARELIRGKAVAIARMGESLWNQAMKGNLGAKIFWLKAQAGWREKQVIEHHVTEADVEVDPREDLSDLLRQYRATTKTVQKTMNGGSKPNSGSKPKKKKK